MTFYLRYRADDGDGAASAVGQPSAPQRGAHWVAARLDRAPWLIEAASAGGAPRGVPTSDLQIDEHDLLCPVTPSKIVGIGRNYAAHAKELGNDLPTSPLMFFKPPSSLLPSGGTVILPKLSQRVEFEAELGVVIGKRCHRLARAEAESAIYGFTPLCDVTARDLQRSDGQWTRAKGFDTFCPAGPMIVARERCNWRDLSIKLWQRGELKQEGTTRDMVFDLPTLIEQVSQVMTLEPGDVIASGTPSGVGPLAAGDDIEIQISDWPRLRFNVAAEV